jgi:hypothetical protein
MLPIESSDARNLLTNAPKPHPLAQPKPKRLPEKNAVTIVAGLRCNGGIILCADSQETVNNYSKRWTPKLIVKPQPWYGKDSVDDLMLAIAGAGDGPFTEKLTERAWEGAKSAPSFDAACVAIEDSIKQTHHEYGLIFQTGYLPSVELIYGVKMEGKSKLFKSFGPIVNEIRSFTSAGAGMHMADFLASRMHQRSIPSTQAMILAAYILFQCKEHVDGCGGDSHIAVLNEHGNSRMLNPAVIDAVMAQLRDVDNVVSTLLLNASDFYIPSEDFERQLKHIIEELRNMRETGKQFRDILDKPSVPTSLRPF